MSDDQNDDPSADTPTEVEGDEDPSGADTETEEDTPDEEEAPQPSSAPVAAPNAPAPVPDPATPAAPEAETPDVAPIAVPALQQAVGQDLKAEDKNHHNDVMQGKITPKTYQDLFNDKDTLGKVGTIFGLLLSGAGSGLAHQPNALLGMMDKQISNDLDAQKTSAANAQNGYRLNQQHQFQTAQIAQMKKAGLLTDAQIKEAVANANTKADALAHMQANRYALHNLTVQRNKLPAGSTLIPKYDQALALISQGVDVQNSNIADKAAGLMGFQTAGGTGEDAFSQNNQLLRLSGNAALAESNEAHHMPGVSGQSSVPLTQEDRNKVEGNKELIASLQRLKDFSIQNPRPIKGSAADIEGKNLAKQAQGAFRNSTNGGVYKESEQKFINDVVPGDPTAWSPFAHVADKIDTVMNETGARNNQFLKSKGFQVTETPKRKVSGATAKEGQTGTVDGKRVVFTNGKWSYSGTASK